MLRKLKGNRRIRKAEKDMDLSTGVIRNKNGRDTRPDRQLKAIRKEQVSKR